MTTKYVIRNKEGTLKATFDAVMLPTFTSQGGSWRPYNAATSNGATVCFEFYEDMALDLTSVGIPMRMNIWNGDKIIPLV